MEMTPCSHANTGTDIFSDRKLSHLEYEDVVELPNEEPSRLQVFLYGHLNDILGIFRVRSSHSKCKMLL